jgi:FdhD protein
MTRNRDVTPAPETPVRLRVNARPVATWTCTPADFEALAVGRCISLGYVRAPVDVLDVRVTPGEGAATDVDVSVPDHRASSARAEADHRRDHGCGLRFLVDCRPDLLGDPPSGAVPDPDDFAELFRALYEGSETRRGPGGHHTAALAVGGHLIHLHEEVGRHNAVDKAIGAWALAGGTLGDRGPEAGPGLLTTARISGDIAAKAARARLGWIASRSVPTTLAVEIAGAAGIPIVARAAGKDARTFHPPASPP